MTDFLGRPPVLKEVPPRSTKIKSIEQLREELSPINKGISILIWGKLPALEQVTKKKVSASLKIDDVL